MNTFSSDDYKGLETNSERHIREAKEYKEWEKQFKDTPNTEENFEFTDYDTPKEEEEGDIEF